MGKINIFIVCVVFLFLSAEVYGQTSKEKNIPAWMENADPNGRGTFLIPKDAKKEKFGSLIKVEDLSEYTARKFYEVDGVIAEMKDKQKKFEEELTEMKKGISDLNDKIDILMEASKQKGIGMSEESSSDEVNSEDADKVE